MPVAIIQQSCFAPHAESERVSAADDAFNTFGELLGYFLLFDL